MTLHDLASVRPSPGRSVCHLGAPRCSKMPPRCPKLANIAPKMAIRWFQTGFWFHFGLNMASKIDHKSTKNRPKSVQNRSWKRSWGILRPSSPQDRPKTAKNVQNGVRGPPPGSKLGPKIDAKSTPKPSKRNTFLYSFSDRVLTPPGTDFHRIRGPKMEQKSTRNRCPERSCRKCKILKKP